VIDIKSDSWSYIELLNKKTSLCTRVSRIMSMNNEMTYFSNFAMVFLASENNQGPSQVQCSAILQFLVHVIDALGEIASSVIAFQTSNNS
jgi:hypothetical protein